MSIVRWLRTASLSWIYQLLQLVILEGEVCVSQLPCLPLYHSLHLVPAQLVILKYEVCFGQLSLLPLLHPPDLLPSHLSPPVAHLALSHEPLSLGGDVVDALEDANKVVLNILSKL